MVTFLYLNIHEWAPVHVPGSVSTFRSGDLSAFKHAWAGSPPYPILSWFSFPVTTQLFPWFGFNIQAWLCCLRHAWTFTVMTFLHLNYIMADANFPLVQFCCSLHPRFGFNIYTSLHLKHLSVVTFLNYSKKCQKICQNRLTHLCVAVVNRLGNSSSHQ